MTVVLNMKYSSRFFLYAPLGVFLLLLAIAGLYWWVLASELSARLEAANGQQVAPGVTMHFASRRITGFPFSLDTEFRDVKFTVATPLGPAAWHSEHFAMHGLTYGRDETIFEAAGHQRLAWRRADGASRTLDFAVASLRASAIDSKDALQRFDLDLVGFGSKAFTAQRLQFHLRRHKGDTLDLYVVADGVRPVPGSCPRLAGPVKDEQFSATVSQAGAFSPVLSASQPWASAALEWRRRGGEVRATPMRGGALHTGLLSLPAENVFSVAAVADAVCGE
jgi:hypothetical protein